jgi:hypothetical protein
LESSIRDMAEAESDTVADKLEIQNARDMRMWKRN